MMLLHVTTPIAWQEALRSGFYESGSLREEGFIHCCLHNQLAGVIERYYASQTPLLILHIDPGALLVPVKWEPSPLAQDLFPHVYGRINLEAVQKTELIVY